MLRPVAEVDLSVEVLGTRLAAPVAVAPMGCQGLAHPGGEVANAAAAASVGVAMTLSTYATCSIEAVAALCDFGVDARLVVVGEGPMRTKLQRQAAGLPIDFTGFVSERRTVAGLLASADVTLAPGPHETFGLAALESLACGTPAVVSRTSALVGPLFPEPAISS